LARGISKPSWDLGDFDYNGFVDDDDVTLLRVFCDPSASPNTIATALGDRQGAIAIPDTSTLVLAAFGVLLLSKRRWHFR